MPKRPKTKDAGPERRKAIRIHECGEVLVDVKKICPRIVVSLGKGKKGAKAYLRKSLAFMLKRAQNYLPKGMTFIIRDAWRSSEEQAGIMESFVERFRRQNPNWTEKRARLEAKKFVADASGVMASGHMTGGAVDLRLWKNGRLVPMRSWKLTYQENAQPYQPKLSKYLQRNREIMYSALAKVGLTQCHNEFWHWSYGDVHWARRTGSRVAKYGVIVAVGKAERRKACKV